MPKEVKSEEDIIFELMPKEMKDNFYTLSIAILQLQDSLLNYKSPLSPPDNKKIYDIMNFHLKQLLLSKNQEARKLWLKHPIYLKIA